MGICSRLEEHEFPAFANTRTLYAIMKLPTLISLFIILYSCNSSKIVGVYADCTNHCHAVNKIQLSGNNTFVYSQFYDVGGNSEVQGKWVLNKDTLTLNSFEQQKDRIDKIEEKTIDSDSMYFEFKNDCGSVLINGASIYPNKLIVSKFSISRTSIKMVEFQFCSDPMLISIRYNILNPKANYFIIYTKNLKSGIFLENQNYLIRRNKLIEINIADNSSKYRHILKRKR
ncbi:MAG: hypothetical protein HZA79_13070 [Sphingobacteriales bacterium]|nr:hypothetical protein [Sphingobacteriales bacterium]